MKGPRIASAGSPRDLLAIPLISLLWGMNWPTLGLALREAPPWTVRAITLGTAGVLLLAFNLIRGNSVRIPRRDWGRLLTFTLLYVVLQNLLISFAQLVAPSGRMAIITFTMPIWTTVLAAVFLGERLTPSSKVSLAFGSAGLAALAWPAIHTDTYWGCILALGSAWCWATSVILIKRYPIGASPLAMATWQLVIGATCVSVGMLIVDGSPLDRSVSTAARWALIYNILSQCVSQVLWFGTLGRLPAALASLGVLLVPMVAVVGSIFMLHEHPTLLDCIGLVLITCASASAQAVWIADWHRARKPIPAKP